MTISSIVASDIIPLKKRGLIQGLVNSARTHAACNIPLTFLLICSLLWLSVVTAFVSPRPPLLTNIRSAVGSGLGAPLGGYIASRFDWRWAFLGQVPFLIAAWILIFSFVRYTLPSQLPLSRKSFQRIDWLGSLTLVCCISGLLLALSFNNNENLPWSNPKVWGSFAGFIVFLAAFITVEARLSPFPVMPLRILASRSPLCIALGNFLMAATSFISE